MAACIIKEKIHPVHQVWNYNFDTEFKKIMTHLPNYQYISFDTEYPGTVYRDFDPAAAQPQKIYENIKKNVNDTNIIQLGITLMDPTQRPEYLVWQFNFKDFDISRGDQHHPASIQFLKDGGVDFEKNVKQGIDSRELAKLMMQSGFFTKYTDKTWVGFHCAFDFAYIIKMVTMEELPCELWEFTGLVMDYFGSKNFDVKFMVIKDCPGLCGGLQNVATLLKVDRCARKCHQAGFDSLLTMKTYVEMRKNFFMHKTSEDLHEEYGCKLFGFKPIQTSVPSY